MIVPSPLLSGVFLGLLGILGERREKIQIRPYWCFHVDIVFGILNSLEAHIFRVCSPVDGAIRRWDLVRGSYINGSMPLKGIMGSQPQILFLGLPLSLPLHSAMRQKALLQPELPITILHLPTVPKHQGHTTVDRELWNYESRYLSSILSQVFFSQLKKAR